LSGVYDLDEAGAFSLPLAGRVTVNGKTTRQARPRSRRAWPTGW